MADWSTNLLIVAGDPESVEPFVGRARGMPHRYDEELGKKEMEDLCFHSLYPVPADVLRAGFSDVGYAWETNNWGVKWGGLWSKLEVASPDEVRYVFSTAWGPPTEFVGKVAADFPHLRFELKWVCVGWVGAAIWEAGRPVDSWERESTDDDDEQLEMAREGHLLMSHVIGNFSRE